jgi:hypothetical protein
MAFQLLLKEVPETRLRFQLRRAGPASSCGLCQTSWSRTTPTNKKATTFL